MREEATLNGFTCGEFLPDKRTAGGCKIRTHLTQFTGHLKLFVHQSSEELKTDICTSV